jgi:hypothetical protein
MGEKLTQRNETRPHLLILSCLVVFTLLLSACDQIAGLVNSIPSVTPSPTPIDCPDAGSNQPNLASLDLRPKLIVVLIESTPTQKEFSDQALQIVEEILPKLIEPGDQIAVFRQGFRDYRDANILDMNPPQVTRQAILPSPTAPSTLLPNVEITPTSFTQLGQTRERNSATETAVAQEGTATLEWAYYNCAQQTWSDNFEDSAKVWEQTKEAIVTSASNEIQGTLDAFQATLNASNLEGSRNPLPTPLANSVYEGLVHVSSVFDGVGCTDEDKGNDIFSRCILLIFDNLYDWRRAEVEAGSIEPNVAWQINLSHVEILPVMLNCLRVYEPRCVDWQEFWTPQFLGQFNADTVQYLDGRDIETKLRDFFNR